MIIITCPGLSINLLEYSSPYLIIPPPEEGIRYFLLAMLERGRINYIKLFIEIWVGEKRKKDMNKPPSVSFHWKSSANIRLSDSGSCTRQVCFSSFPSSKLGWLTRCSCPHLRNPHSEWRWFCFCAVAVPCGTSESALKGGRTFLGLTDGWLHVLF